MNLARNSRMLFTAGLLLFAADQRALAHKVNIFAYAQGDSIYTESYFNDGRKCVNSTVTTYDASGGQLAEGTTDAEGLFAFRRPELPAPRRGDLKIVLVASMGHRAEYSLPATEIWGKEVTPDGQETTASLPVADPGSTPVAVESTPNLDQLLARRLSPLTEAIRQLEKQQERASFRDIIGGIGYIVGLLGLYYYLRGRSR